MSKTVNVKFIKENGEAFEVGTGYMWRFQNAGFSGFSEFVGSYTTSANSSRDGGNTDNIRLDSKDRTIKFAYLDWRDSERVRARWKRFFRYGDTYKVYATFEGVTLWNKATIKRMALSEPTESDYLPKVTMTLHFDNPYWMSVDNFGKDLATITPNFGFPWMCPVNKSIPVGVFNFSRSVTINNDGEQVVYPVFTIRFSDEVVNPVVSVNDGFIRINGTFNRDDLIEIDYTNNPPTVRNNGENILGYCDRTSNFDGMYILIGDNVVSFDAETGTDEMSVVFKFNKLYTIL